MKLNISKFKNYLLLLLLFVLPWQTRLIYQTTYIGSGFWEYGSLSLYSTEILLGLVILSFLIEKIKGNFQDLFINRFNKKRLVVVLLSVFSILAIYLFGSSDRAVTWQYLNWLIYGLCLIFIVLESKISFEKLSLWIWLGGLAQAIIATWQFFNQYIPANKWLGMAVQDPHQLGVAVVEFGDERWLRSYGSFGWPNSLGIYLASVFVLGIILTWQEKNKNTKLWYLLGQIIVLVGLFFTFARGAWLATIISLLFVGLKNYKEKYLWQQLGVYALAFMMLLIIFKPLVFSRVDFQNRLEKISLSQRVTQWSQFQQVFANNYFIGSTPGNYTISLHELYPKYFVGDLKPAHNIYLLFVAEWGILGLVLLFWLLINSKEILNWSFAPLVVALVAGFFDHWSISTFTGLIFFCLIIGISIKYNGIDTKVSQE